MIRRFMQIVSTGEKKKEKYFKLPFTDIELSWFQNDCGR